MFKLLTAKGEIIVKQDYYLLFEKIRKLFLSIHCIW